MSVHLYSNSWVNVYELLLRLLGEEREHTFLQNCGLGLRVLPGVVDFTYTGSAAA